MKMIPSQSWIVYYKAYWYYANGTVASKSTYGLLYNWVAVMHGASSNSAVPSGVQGICPDGWHVPSYAEWKKMTDYVSSQSQYFCSSNSSNIAKALASTNEWQSNNTACGLILLRQRSRKYCIFAVKNENGNYDP